MKSEVSVNRIGPRRLALFAILLALPFIGQPGRGNFDRLLPGIGTVTAQQMNATLVNAASYANDAAAGIAPDSLGALYGQFVTQGGQSYPAPPGVTPLPTTLGGVSVSIGGKPASLFFVGTGQINLLVPADLADGNAAIVVTNSDTTTRTGTVKIVRSEPGVFTALSSGAGTAAALTTRDGQTYNFVSNADGSGKSVDPGTREQLNYLVLFGTGIRKTPATNAGDANGVAEAVTVTIQGVPVPVYYAGPAPGFVGLDQINVSIPPELAGLGTVRVRVKTATREANNVTLNIGGTVPVVRLTPIGEAQTVNGELTADDQVQAGADSNTYFFDGYVFTTSAPNTTIAIDMRSARFNAQVLLFRIQNGALTQIGQDDDTGAYGSLTSANNTDSLLLATIPAAGQYAIFASSSDVQANGLGTYTLNVTTNVMQPISYGQTVSGQIAVTDYKNSANTYLDIYTFTGVINETLRIGLSSAVFDSFVILQDNDGDPPLAFDDNAGGGFNSQITSYRLMTSGTFIIIATPFEPNRTGAYSLSLTRLSTTAMNPGVDQLNLVGGRSSGGPGRSPEMANFSFVRSTRFRPASERQVSIEP